MSNGFEGSARTLSAVIRGIALAVVSMVLSSNASAAPHHRHHVRPVLHFTDANGNSATIIGTRPGGCPSAYCGCGLARYLGLHDRRLYLAWNWARLFSRTYPHAGAAAVRHGHVMLLQQHIAGTHWRVIDFNGGRHLSWIHERDVRGYVFVEPGTRVAVLASKRIKAVRD